MKKLTVTDILSDIEFELAQGVIFQGDLGASIQSIRNYQNRMRDEVLGGTQRAPDLRNALARLFQINDMLITVCQEMTVALAADRRRRQRMERLPQQPSPVNVTAATSAPQPDFAAETHDDAQTFELGSWALPENVREAMGPEALKVSLDVRVPKIPLLGSLIGRLRLALHNLVLFYVRRLARKQNAVNQVYGQWISQLIQSSQAQSRQIEELHLRLEELTAMPEEEA